MIYIFGFMMSAYIQPRFIGVAISSVSQICVGVWIIWATTLIPIELGTALSQELLTKKLISKAWLEAKTKYIVNKGCMNLDDIYTYEEMLNERNRLEMELEMTKKRYSSGAQKQHFDTMVKKCFKNVLE